MPSAMSLDLLTTLQARFEKHKHRHYHNGAQSYYAARGFRGRVRV